jgi:hypothetical protein
MQFLEKSIGMKKPDLAGLAFCGKIGCPELG